MARIQVGSFQYGLKKQNVFLQGNLIRVYFPYAEDKNIEVKSGVPDIKVRSNYQYRYKTQAIYVRETGTSSSNYISIENTDSVVISSWSDITVFEDADGLYFSEKILTAFPTDVSIIFELRVKDSNDYSEVKSSERFFLLANKPPSLINVTVAWSGDSLNFSGDIEHLGITVPKNQALLNKNLENGDLKTNWLHWRTALHGANFFGSLSYQYAIKYGTSSESIVNNLNISSSYNFAGNNNTDKIFTYSIGYSNSPEVFTKDLTYYFRVFLRVETNQASPDFTLSPDLGDIDVLYSILPPQVPFFAYGRGGIMVNMPSGANKIGGGTFARGSVQGSEGHSVALYDRYIPIGSNETENKPSLGFYTDDNKLMASIFAENIGTEQSPNYQAVLRTNSQNIVLGDTSGKADKVPSAGENNLVSFDASGNLKDSSIKTSDFTGKADKVSGAVNNNFASLDANGNLKDSGNKAGDFSLSGHKHDAGDVTSGTLSVDRGGTGQTTAAGIRNTLGLGNTTGALPIENGGTGQTTAALVRNALGLGNTTDALPIANGGTGATTVAAARNALGLGNTAGALPVANGGTGATTLTSGSFLQGNGTGQVTLRTPAQALSDLPIELLKVDVPTVAGQGSTYADIDAPGVKTSSVVVVTSNRESQITSFSNTLHITHGVCITNGKIRLYFSAVAGITTTLPVSILYTKP